VTRFKEIAHRRGGVGSPTIDGQLEMAIRAVFEPGKARGRHLPPEEQTKIRMTRHRVNVVAMVVGNVGENSGTGAPSPATTRRGQKYLASYLTRPRAGTFSGAGTRCPRRAQRSDHGVLQGARQVMQTLEHHSGQCDIEFTVEQGKLGC